MEWLLRNERFRGVTKVGEISRSMQELLSKWHEHVTRRDEEYAGKIWTRMDVGRSRKKGRP